VQYISCQAFGAFPEPAEGGCPPSSLTGIGSQIDNIGQSNEINKVALEIRAIILSICIGAYDL